MDEIKEAQHAMNERQNQMRYTISILLLATLLVLTTREKSERSGEIELVLRLDAASD